LQHHKAKKKGSAPEPSVGVTQAENGKTDFLSARFGSSDILGRSNDKAKIKTRKNNNNNTDLGTAHM
jgi:hypothetical protein